MSKKYKIVASVSTNICGSKETTEWDLDEDECKEVESLTGDQRSDYAWENGGEDACNELCDMGAWIEEI